MFGCGKYSVSEKFVKKIVKMGVECTDVEMKNADSPPGLEGGDSKKDTDQQSLLELREHARQIEKAVANKENRFILRVLRGLPNTRRKLNGAVLRGIYRPLCQSLFSSFRRTF